jgi:hypothetical protein
VIDLGWAMKDQRERVQSGKWRLSGNKSVHYLDSSHGIIIFTYIKTYLNICSIHIAN